MEDMAAGRRDLLVGMSKKLVGHTEFAFRDQIKVSRPTPSDVLPSIRLHFPKIPQYVQVVPPNGGQKLKHMSLWETFYIQTTEEIQGSSEDNKL